MRRIFYPTQSNSYDTFSSNKDIVGLSNPFSPCEELREFIRKEEEFSFNDWKAYRQSIIKYENGVPETQKPELVMTLARQLVKVLKSDLRIYKNMKKRPECVDAYFYGDLDKSIEFTTNVIGYYDNGKILPDINAIFNPFKEPDFNEYPVASGTYWDTEFYSEYESVEKYLVQPLLKESSLSYQEQPSQEPQLADWQINPPPYPFKIIDDNFSSFPLTVSKEGINTSVFGTPIIANIKDPMYSGYRVCREGECGDINPNLSYKEPSLADWQINPPPYPFKITNDKYKMYIPPITVTKEGISSRDDFGRPIFVNIKDPGFSDYRLCKEGECDNIPELTTTTIGL